ncbi:hypothetical protein FACS1894195_1590 [Bacteroidia bacterium]|nr:hypothetical protein FACS1894195_1590 [Bacteroidia bacterium]
MERKDRFLIYSTPGNDVKVDVFLQDETVWLTQKAIATLFGVEIPAISKHLKNIFESGELVENSTVSKMETVQNEGNRQIKRTMDYYNLDAIISVGYRVNSVQATHFRYFCRM